jgi:hypothetical protein
MNIEKWINFFKRKVKEEAVSNADLPILWEDDYCQVQFLPISSSQFIYDQLKAIELFTSNHDIANGFSKIFERQNESEALLKKQIVANEFAELLQNEGWRLASHYLYENRIVSKSNSSTWPFILQRQTVFVEQTENLVTTIWLSLKLIVSVELFNQIKNTFLLIGQRYNLLLVDWNNLETIDLKDQEAIDRYLMTWFK